MKIKFIQEDGYKSFREGKYEFYVTKQGMDGYTLEAWEWYHVEDKYIANKYCTRRVSIPWEMPSNLDRIRERISEFIN